MGIVIFKEANTIWKKMTENALVDELEFELEVHKKLFDFFLVGDYYYYMMNIANAQIEYVSNGVATVLGYKTENFTLEFYVNKVHPDDAPYFLNFENKCAGFFQQLPSNKLEKYKVRYDIRIQKSNGDYIRILHQSAIIQYDNGGIILRTLAVDTDITHLKKEGKPVLSFIGLDGEPSFINVDVEQVFAPTPTLLSRREEQILMHMIEGKLSKEIAEMLNISHQTVETHRKNMVRKANVKNSAELIGVAIKRGWV
jgi:DNA-binding CsgD family transcriptional regulator